jgi:signal peptidase I
VVKFVRDLGAALAVLGALVALGLGFVGRPVLVVGDSMAPALLHGERVLMDLVAFRRRAPAEGDVVVLRGPQDAVLIKRIRRGPLPRAEVPFLSPFRPETADEPWYEVAGDHEAASLDSRTFGPIPAHRIRGRVAWRYWPLSRLGPID